MQPGWPGKAATSLQTSSAAAAVLRVVARTRASQSESYSMTPGSSTSGLRGSEPSSSTAASCCCSCCSRVCRGCSCRCSCARCCCCSSCPCCWRACRCCACRPFSALTALRRHWCCGCFCRHWPSLHADCGGCCSEGDSTGCCFCSSLCGSSAALSSSGSGTERPRRRRLLLPPPPVLWLAGRCARLPSLAPALPPAATLGATLGAAGSCAVSSGPAGCGLSWPCPCCCSCRCASTQAASSASVCCTVLLNVWLKVRSLFHPGVWHCGHSLFTMRGPTSVLMTQSLV